MAAQAGALVVAAAAMAAAVTAAAWHISNTKKFALAGGTE